VATTDGQNVDKVGRFFEFMHHKQIDQWGDLWANDARIMIPYPPDGFASEIVGKDEIVPGFRQLFANFETYDYAVKARYQTVDPDVIIVEWSVTAKIKSTGETYEGDNITVFRFADGRIVEYHDYFNPAKFARVIEALPTT
jgi:uncharacterized protein